MLYAIAASVAVSGAVIVLILLNSGREPALVQDEHQPAEEARGLPDRAPAEDGNQASPAAGLPGAKESTAPAGGSNQGRDKAGGVAVFRGKVTDAANGSPVSRAKLVLTGEGGEFSAESDAFGEFRMECKKPGAYRLRAEAPGYIESDFQFRVQNRTHDAASGPDWTVDLAAGGEVVREVRLYKGIGISGEVVDDGGEPVEDAALSLGLYLAPWSDNPFGMTLGIGTKSDWKGSFAFAHGFPPGNYAMSAVKSGFQKTNCDFAIFERQDRDAKLRIVLNRPSLFLGRVVSADGKPIDGASVFSCYEHRAKSGRFRFDPSDANAISDSDGKFSLDVAKLRTLGRGRPFQGVLVSAKGFAPRFQGGIEPSTQEKDVVLVPELTLDGVVTDEVGNPLPGARVFMIECRGAESALLLPASWLDCEHSDRSTGPAELVRRSGRIAPAGGDARTARDPSAIEALDMWGFYPDSLDEESPGCFAHKALADGQGKFRIGGVPDDGKPVKMFFYAGGEHMDRVHSWAPGSPTRFVLERRPILEIAASDQDGKPVPSFEVWLHPDWDRGGCQHSANGGAVALPDTSDRIVVVVQGQRAKDVELRSLVWGERRKVSVVLPPIPSKE